MNSSPVVVVQNRNRAGFWALLVAFLVLAPLGLYQGAYSRLSPRVGDAALTESERALEARIHESHCDFWQDGEGVPHARARTNEVAYACLGYLHARYRAWQMDYLRRAGEGRRAEIYGIDALRQDFFVRHLRLAEKAREIFEGMSEAARLKLVAYSTGVNRGLQTEEARSAPEWKEWRFEPDPWRPQDTLTVLLIQSFDQSRRSFETDVSHANRMQRFPGTTPETFTDAGLPWDTAIVSALEGSGAGAEPASARAEPDASLRMLAGAELERAWPKLLSESDAIGSNSWVLAPKKSASGKAWLANDPHLDLKRPAFWFWAHIEAPGWDAMGASLAGAPVIVSGANRNVAWGLTNSYLSVGRAQAIPAEQIDPGRERVRPVLAFRIGGLVLPFFFRTSDWTTLPGGARRPLLPIQAPAGQEWVLHWSGLDLTGKRIEAFLELMEVGSVDAMDEVLSRVELPAFNFVFADTRGKIAYRAFGRVPNWGGDPTESVPEERMPQLKNPARGWIATANNRHFQDDARQAPLGHAYATSLRANRIHELLQARPRHDLDSIRRAQCDVEVVDARFALPQLAERLGHPLEAVGQATLDCVRCGHYRSWMEALLREFDGSFSYFYRVISGMEQREDWSANEEIEKALEMARKDEERDRKPWGELHRAPFDRLSGAIPSGPREALPTPGDEHTVNPGSLRANEPGAAYPWRHTAGASQRLVVELTSPPRIHKILAGPNDGSASDDLLAEGGAYRAWRDCELKEQKFPLDWTQVPKAEIRLGLSEKE